MRTMIVVAVAALMLTSACTSYRAYRRAQMAATAEDWDQAVLFYMRALEEDPNNITYRAALLRAKSRAAQEHFDKARRYYDSGVLERAMVEYQQAVQLDPSNQSAVVELDKVRRELSAARGDRPVDATLEEMKRRVSAESQPPVLNPRSDEPIDLDFPEPVAIKDIYRALGRAFGINIMFDAQLKEQEIALTLKEVTAQDALEFMMRTANHFYKVLDEHSIIIITDTPQNRRTYEDLVIKTFFLSNAEVKDVVTMLRSLIDAKKIATNEQLNAIILRDTADKVKVAERIINANDKAKAEVVIDVELLQINTSKLRDLGVTWPSSIASTLDVGGESVPLRLSDLEFLNQSNWTLTIPSFIYDFVKTSTNAQLLARPQLRISEGEKASLVIGDRVPIPVTSFNTANTVGSNVVPITSFQYQDVGIKISLEPRVHHNKEVTLKVMVEVSNLSGQVQTGNTSQPIIGTRTIESTIRLQDGETNFLAGLIRTDDTNSDSGLPGFSEIPVIGRLFSKNRSQNQRTDVILTLTPHIIRSADITEEDLQPIWVGTEANITFRGGSPRVESDVEGPFDGDEPDAENIRELIQRRIQRLPRGLRDPNDPSAVEQAPPPGAELVPGGPPSSFGEEEPEEEEEELPPDVGGPGEPPDGLVSVGPPATGVGPAGWLVAAVGALGAGLADDGAGPAAAAVELWLSPRRPTVTAGELFEVVLMASSPGPLSHLPLRLAYDPELLVVEAVRDGGFLGASGEAQLLADLSQPGVIVLGASRLGNRPGVNGSGEVAVITFRARRPGHAEIVFSRARALGPDLGEVAPLATVAAGIEIERSRPERPARPERPRRPEPR